MYCLRLLIRKNFTQATCLKDNFRKISVYI